MATFSPGDVIKVPFPYADRPVREQRPALVVAQSGALSEPGLLWVLMITSATHRPWGGDVPVTDLLRAGLPAPSVVRTAKVATIAAKEALPLGQLGATGLSQVHEELDKILNRGA